MLSHLTNKDRGQVTYGDIKKKTGKIIGGGDIGILSSKIHNVLFVDGLKHNILSISQLCDQNG